MDICHHVWISKISLVIYFMPLTHKISLQFLFKFHPFSSSYVVQADLKLMGSSNLPASPSQVAVGDTHLGSALILKSLIYRQSCKRSHSCPCSWHHKLPELVFSQNNRFHFDYFSLVWPSSSTRSRVSGAQVPVGCLGVHLKQHCTNNLTLISLRSTVSMLVCHTASGLHLHVHSNLVLFLGSNLYFALF